MAYDRRGNEYDSDTLSRPSVGDLQKITGIDADEAAKIEKKALSEQESKDDVLGKGHTGSELKSEDPSSIKDQESSTDSDGFFNGKYSPKKRIKHAAAKRTAGGVIGLASILGILGIGSITSGPLMVLNAASALKPNFSVTEQQGDDMSTRALIYAMLGNANKGRLGIIGTKISSNYEAKMIEKSGVRPIYNQGGANRGAGFEIVDEAKARASGLWDELERSGLSESDGSNRFTRGDGTSTAGSRVFATNELSFGQRRAIIRQVSSSTGTKGIVKFFQNHLQIKRSGLNLHPMNNIKKKVDETHAQYKERKRQASRDAIVNGIDPNRVGDTQPGTVDADRDGTPDAPSAESEEVSRAANEAAGEVREGVGSEDGKSKFKANLAKAAGPAAVVGMLCMVRGISDGYPNYVYANNVLPLMRMSGELLASASQIESGKDLTMDEVGVLAEMLYDTDPSTPDSERDFNSNVVNRTREGKSSGAEIPGEAMISSDKPVVLKIADHIFAGAPINPLNWVCEAVDMAGQAPVIKQIGEGFEYVINGALSVFGTSTDQLMGGLYSLIGGPEAVTELKGGALGAAANVGAFLLANDQSTGIGGEARSAAEYSQLMNDARANIAYENKDKSVFERYLSLESPDSLLAKTVTNSPRSIGQITKMFTSSPSTTIESVASLGNSKVYAAQAYQYPGLNGVAYSSAEMSDPAFENPDINEAVMTDSVLTALNSKYGKCYGSTIDPTTGALITGSGVNFLEKNGGELADCSDEGAMITDSEGNARSEKTRFRFYLAYAMSIHSLACLGGDVSSCASASSTAGAADGSDTPTAGSSTGGYGATPEQLEGLPQACKDGTASGSVRVLCVGAKYRNLVPYKLVHPYTGKVFSERWNSGMTETSLGESGKKTKLTLDCSLFIGTVLYDAYGIDFTTTSQNYNNPTYFKKIPLADVQPGDIIVSPGHISIVNEPGVTVLDTGWIHPTSPIDDLNIHKWANDYTSALRYIGPNAEGTSVHVGGGTTGGGTTTPSTQNGQGVQLDGVDGLITGNQFTANKSVIPKVTNIVIHWFGSNTENPADAASALASTGTSVQFYVSKGGKIMQLTEYANTKASHAKNANEFAIGIEIGSLNAKTVGDVAPYPKLEKDLLDNTKQKQQVIKLVTALAKKFGITTITINGDKIPASLCREIGFNFDGTCATQAQASQYGIVGHYQLQSTKDDPGRTYVQEIQRAVKANIGGAGAL